MAPRREEEEGHEVEGKEEMGQRGGVGRMDEET